MTLFEAQEIARSVKTHLAVSYVDAAEKLADFVLGLTDIDTLGTRVDLDKTLDEE